MIRVKPKIRNPLTFVLPKEEINDEVSMTQPDMTLTIRQLLDHHTRGTLSLQEKTPVYNEDIDVPNFAYMDLVEIQEYRMELAEKMKNDKAKFEHYSRLQVQQDEQRLKQRISDEIKNSNPKMDNTGD